MSDGLQTVLCPAGCGRHPLESLRGKSEFHEPAGPTIVEGRTNGVGELGVCIGAFSCTKLGRIYVYAPRETAP